MKYESKTGQALATGEHTFREIVEFSPGAIISCVDGTVSLWNRAAAKLFGYSQEEALGMEVTAIIPEMYKEAHLAGWNRFRQKGDLKHEGAVLEVEGCRKDGTIVPIAMSCSARRESGSGKEKLFSTVIMRDITDRKRAEDGVLHKQRQLEALLEVSRKVNVSLEIREVMRQLVDSAIALMNATSGTAGLMEDGRMVFKEYRYGKQSISIDYAFDDGFGVPGHVMQTKSPYMTNDAEDDPHVVPEIRRALKFHRLINVPILNASGELLGCFEIHDKRDSRPFDGDDIALLQGLAASASIALENARLIQERKRSDEELKKLDKLQSVGVLAGGIAHDFNNLLTVIVGGIDLAKMWFDPAHKSYGILALAEKSAMKGRELSNRLITFSSGGVPVKKIVALPALIKESAEFALSGSDAYLKLHLPDNIWPVEADAGQINQVINNLVRNGAQAMSGGGTVTVSLENAEVLPGAEITLKAGKYVKVRVEDHGEGISSDIQDKIFDPYFSTRKMGSQKGTGLGLAIVHSIIKEHDGHIGFESKVGEGSTFYFYLPASEKEAPVREEDREEEEEAKMAEGKARALILEDDESVSLILTGLLEKLGYEAVVAREGNEALRLYKEAMGEESTFYIVIVDLVIRGGMGGRETMEKLLKVDPHITALVSSGSTKDPAVVEYKRYGFAGALTKPYTAEKLKAVLNRLRPNDG